MLQLFGGFRCHGGIMNNSVCWRWFRNLVVVLIAHLLSVTSWISWAAIVVLRCWKQFLLNGLMSYVGSSVGVKTSRSVLCRVHNSGKFLYEPCWCLTTRFARLDVYSSSCWECRQIRWSILLISSIPRSSGKRLSFRKALMLFRCLIYQRQL